VDAREVVLRRLTASGLTGPPRPSPEQVVGHLLAVQSQDVQPSSWSVAQRTEGATDAVVTQARDDGRLLRTHVLRTTWHDVGRQDLRWLLALTAPRVRQLAAGARRQLGLDDELLATARRAVEPAVTGRALTRAQLAKVLADAGLRLDARALGYVLMLLELDAVVCSGVRERHLHTYALLDERVPPAPAPDEPAVELARRFLRGHGPATVQDLAWWSSLRVTDLRRALTALGDEVRRDDVDSLELWSPADAPPPAPPPGLQLVQAYDEHLVAFTASKHLTDPGRVVGRRERPYMGVVLLDGVVAGSWGRTATAAGVTVRVTPMQAPLDGAGLQAAAQAYGDFLGLPATVVLEG
jgi:hypothetical protein